MKNIIIIILIFVIPVVAYNLLSKHETEPVSKTVDTSKPQIIKFSSLMCVECKKLEGVINEVYPKYKNEITLTEVHIQNNDDYTKKMVEKYHVTLTPTMIIINPKTSKVSKIEGFVEKDKLDKLMKDLVNK